MVLVRRSGFQILAVLTKTENVVNQVNKQIHTSVGYKNEYECNFKETKSAV